MGNKTANYNWDYGIRSQKPWWTEWENLWTQVDTELYKRSKDLYMQGKIVYGSDTAGQNLEFHSNPSKDGKIYLGDNAYFDEVNDNLILASEKGLKLTGQGVAFSFASGSAVFSGTRDDWSQWAYNIIPGTNTKIDLTEPVIKWNMEANFNTGVSNLMEVNLDYLSIDGLVTRRPFSVGINRATDAISWDLKADAMAFYAGDGLTQWMRLGGASAAINQKLSVGSDDLPTNTLFVNGDSDFDGHILLSDGKHIGQDSGPLITFDDTNNYLEITGCNVGINNTAPASELDVTGVINGSIAIQTPGVMYSTGVGTALGGFAVSSSALVVDTDKSIPYHGICWKTFSDAAGNLSMTLQGYNGIRVYTTGLERLRIDGSGNVNIVSGVLKMASTQVVGARVIDARIDDVINSGDATTDGVIDAIRDALITHGLIAAS